MSVQDSPLPETPPGSPVTFKPYPLLFLIGLLLLCLVGLVGFLLGQQSFPSTPTPLLTVSPTPAFAPDLVWNTFSSTRFPLTLAYPEFMSLQEYPSPDGSYSISLSPSASSDSSTPITLHVGGKNFKRTDFYYGGYSWTQSVLTTLQPLPDGASTDHKYDTLQKLGTQSLTGSTAIKYRSTPKSTPSTSATPLTNLAWQVGDYTFLLTWDDSIADTLMDQLISRLSFTPSSSPSPAPTSVPLLSTSNWLTAKAKSYSLKHPPGFTSFISGDLINLFSTANQATNLSIDRVGDPATSKPFSVYSGGSRREWFMRANYDSDHPAPPDLRFVDAQFGSVAGLEVFAGSDLMFILVTHGSNLYQLSSTFDRQVFETLVSTLRFN